jgi:hypothetical protein
MSNEARARKGSGMPSIDGSNSLADLAARIKAEHDAVGHALKRGLEHAIAAGRLLIEAKEQLAHGQWLPWLRDHCQVSERMAQRYMLLARHAPELEAKSDTVSDLGVRGALALLAVPRRQSGESLSESDRWVALADHVAEGFDDALELDWIEKRIAERKSQRSLLAEALSAVEKIGELATTPELVEIIDRESEDFCARIVAGCGEYRSAKTGHEAFDAEGTSLGLYPNQKAAMGAVARAAATDQGIGDL